MKFPRILIAFVLILAISCKKNDTNQEAVESIAGHWHIYDYEPGANSPEAESSLAKMTIVELVDRFCDPLEFSFQSNGEASSINGMKYLSATLDGGELNVDCAPQYDIKYGTFDFDGTTLTLFFDDETTSYTARLNGEFLTVDVNALPFNGVNLSGQLIYKLEP